MGVKRIISRVSKGVNIPLFDRVGIDITVSPKLAALHEIKNLLSEENNIDILATVEQGKGEVLEIKGETNVYDAVKVHLFIGIESMMIDAY